MTSNMILGTSESTQEVKKMAISLLGDFNFNNYGQRMVKIPYNWLFLAITDSNLGPVSLQIDPMASNMK